MGLVRWHLLLLVDRSRLLTPLTARCALSDPSPTLAGVHDPVLVSPAAVPDLTVGAEPLSGVLLAWRWIDQEHGRLEVVPAAVGHHDQGRAAAYMGSWDVGGLTGRTSCGQPRTRRAVMSTFVDRSALRVSAKSKLRECCPGAAPTLAAPTRTAPNRR